MIPDVKKILYATDLKDKEASNAFRMAVSFSQVYGAQLIITHAMEPISNHVYGVIKNEVSKEVMERIQNEGVGKAKADIERQLRAFCERECPNPDKHYAGGQPIIDVEEGDCAEVILSMAQKHQADLIVMGTRTHTTLGQVLLGSTANKVIHHSKVPVTVFPL